MLKNAKDSCAAEALEIAAYTAIARLARIAGDAKTERLAESVLVVGAGYSGERRVFERLAGLGVRAAVVDEPGHWSESLVADRWADAWISAPVTGDADADAASVLAALRHDSIRADGVAT